MIILCTDTSTVTLEDERFTVTIRSGKTPIEISMTPHQARCLAEQLLRETNKFDYSVRERGKPAELLHFQAA